MAQADSSGIEYRDAPPGATGNEIPTSEAPAVASKKKGGQAPDGSTTSDGSENGSSEEKSGAGPGGKGSGPGQADPGKSQSNPGKAGGSSQLAPAHALGTSPSSDDGSSPLVPILLVIGILVLAAIAAVVIRQRRQRDASDAHVSPEAS